MSVSRVKDPNSIRFVGTAEDTLEVEEGQVARLSWVGLVLGGAGWWYVYPGVSLLETVIRKLFRSKYVLTQVATT